TGRVVEVGERSGRLAPACPVHPPYAAYDIRDLPHRRPGAYRVDDRLHEPRRWRARRFSQLTKRGVHVSRFPFPPYLRHPPPLRRGERRVIRRRNRRDLLIVLILVHTHHHLVPRLDRPL